MLVCSTLQEAETEGEGKHSYIIKDKGDVQNAR